MHRLGGRYVKLRGILSGCALAKQCDPRLAIAIAIASRDREPRGPKLGPGALVERLNPEIP